MEPLIDAGYDLINAAEFAARPGAVEAYQFKENQRPQFQGGEVTTSRWMDEEYLLAANLVHNALILAIREDGKGETTIIQPWHSAFYREESIRPGAPEPLTKERTKQTMHHLNKAIGHFGIYDLLDLAEEVAA